ncbi:HNH endonuclease signature motif containing protein [Orbus wheelerorum]|uniref:HNH endonuclease n=1 Tax=Orbus wheelerorum TaxID=3074111 RepID=UPI00370DCA87
MKLNKSQRLELFNKFNGRCAYCGCELQKGWHADHIEPIYRKLELKFNGSKVIAKQTGESFKPEFDCIDNLFPSCPQCNRFKSVYSVEQFREKLQKQVDIARKYSSGFRLAEKYGLVTEVSKSIVFYFEKVGV